MKKLSPIELHLSGFLQFSLFESFTIDFTLTLYLLLDIDHENYRVVHGLLLGMYIFTVVHGLLLGMYSFTVLSMDYSFIFKYLLYKNIFWTNCLLHLQGEGTVKC